MAGRLEIAVVGHTNTGKTSLLRTLTRDAEFGEISDAPTTTRHVEGAQLLVDGKPVIALYDTPGLEDAAGVLDWLEAHADGRHDQVETLRRFLAAPEAAGRFEQEAKVFRQLLESDVGLYVIDAREPVLGKYRDELQALGACARPLLPVLNFVAAGDTRERQWREALAEQSLHAIIAFDTVVFDAESELRLYEKLHGMLDAHREPLSHLIETRRRDQAMRRETAVRQVADLAIDVAACVRVVDGGAAAASEAMEALRDEVRAHEQRCVDTLLEVFGFTHDDFAAGDLPLEQGEWDLDLFTSEAMREYGIRAGRGGAVGAAAGLIVDVASAGLTLGAGTASGAAVGAAWNNRRGLGRRLWHRLQGQRELRVDPATLQLLVVRQLALIGALSRRGHGATGKMQSVEAAAAPWRDGELPAALQRAQVRPEWSRLNPGVVRLDSPSRAAALEALAARLLREGGLV